MEKLHKTLPGSLLPKGTLALVLFLVFQGSSLENSQNAPKSWWLTLQRAITRSSCHLLRSSSLFTVFQRSKGTRERFGGGEGHLVSLCCLEWLVLSLCAINTTGLASSTLWKDAVSCLNFVYLLRCISFPLVCEVHHWMLSGWSAVTIPTRLMQPAAIEQWGRTLL